MFNVISQNWAGQPLVSYETVLKFICIGKTEAGFHFAPAAFPNPSLVLIKVGI
jgi:hypothetical protein